MRERFSWREHYRGGVLLGVEGKILKNRVIGRKEGFGGLTGGNMGGDRRGERLWRRVLE